METNETETQLAATVLNSKDRVEEIPAMAPEIEQYLMSKFEKGLDVNAKGSSKIPFVTKFREIKTLLTKILCLSPRGNPSMREKLYSLNDLFVESQMLSEKHYMFFSPEDLVTMNNIRMKLNKIKMELKEVMKDQRAASNGNIRQQPKNGSSADTCISKSPETSFPPAYEFKVHGFDEDAIIVKKLLLSRTNDDGFKAIAIVGTKGIGKTTLSQMIFNQPEVKTHFLPRIWVSMSNDDNVHKDPKQAIVMRMLISLGVEKETINVVSDSHGLQGLLFALYLQLVGKRYLIVLDDARDKDSWYKQMNSWGLADDKKCETRFGDGLPKGYGGRVIVTSRNEELAKTMVGEKNLHHLLPLTDPKSCWAIFKDAVKDDTYNPSNVEDLQMEVKQKCGGIPLAAKMMGEMRSKQRQDEAGVTSTLLNTND